jgi:hypothetical protein
MAAVYGISDPIHCGILLVVRDTVSFLDSSGVYPRQPTRPVWKSEVGI